MPELTPEHKAKLDTNIKNMLASGASEDDVKKYATDFNNQFALKKKELANSQSISDGGTSELETGASEQKGFNWSWEKAQQDLEKQQPTLTGALGTKFKVPAAKAEGLTATTLQGVADLPVNQQVTNIISQTGIGEEKQLKQKADFYDTQFLPKQKAKELAGVPTDSKSQSVDFYLDYLKHTDPDQHSYEVSKFGELNEAVNKAKQHLVDAQKTGDADEVKTWEDRITKRKQKMEVFQDELFLKASSLNADVFDAKNRILNANIKNYYGGDIKQVDNYDAQAKNITNQLQTINTDLSSLPKDANGNVILTPSNSRDVKEKVKIFQDLQERLKTVVDSRAQIVDNPEFQNLITQQKDVQEQYNKIVTDAKDHLSNFPLAKQKAIAEQAEQIYTDKEYANMTPDMKIKASSTAAVGHAVTDFVAGIAYLPKLFGKGNEYGWTDKLYEGASEGIDKFNKSFLPLPSAYDKPTYSNVKNPDGTDKLDENGEPITEWNTEYLPAKVSRGLADMGLMLAGGELGAGVASKIGATANVAEKIGTFTGGFLLEAQQSYKSAVDAGMSEKDAEWFSGISGSIKAALEFVSPNKKILESGIIKKAEEMFINGASKLDVTKAITKEIGEKILKENGQEGLQLAGEKLTEHFANQVSGANFKVLDNLKSEIIETGIITSLVTLGASAPSSMGTNLKRLNDESLFAAAQNPDKIAARIVDMVENKTLTQEAANLLQQKITFASEELSKIPDNFDNNKKIQLLPDLLEKRMLEEKKKQTDKVFHPLIDEKIQEQEIKIQKEAGIPVEEKTTANESTTKERSAAETTASDNNLETEQAGSAIDNQQAQEQEVKHPEFTPTETQVAQTQETIKSLPAGTEIVSYNTIPVGKLIPAKELVAEDPKQVEEIKNAIAEGKEVAPVVVEQNGENFDVKEGHDKLIAYQEAGIKDVPSVVVKNTATHSKNDFEFSRADENNGYAAVSNINENDVDKTVKEFVGGLTGARAEGNTSSKYFYTGKKIDGKEVVIRVANHPHKDHNVRGEFYTFSILVNSEEEKGTIHGEDYTQLSLQSTPKKIEDDLLRIKETIDDLFHKKNSIGKKQPKPKINENEKQKTKEAEVLKPAKQAEDKVPPVTEKSNEKKARKITKRLDENYWNDVLEKMTDEEKFYNPTKVAEIDAHIKAIVTKTEKDGRLTDLAEQLISDKSPIEDSNTSLRAKFVIGARLREMSLNEKNEVAKQELIRLSARLLGNASQILTAAGTIPGIMNDINKFLPSSEFLKKQTEDQLSEIQDANMSKEQKEDIRTAFENITDFTEDIKIQEAIAEQVERLTEKKLAEEREKIYEAANGKEKTQKVIALREKLTMKEEKEC